MLLSLIVYTTSLALLYGGAYVYVHSKRSLMYKPVLSATEIVLPILIVSIIMGLRYNVGTDWINYKDAYEEIRDTGANYISSGGYEPLYILLNAIVGAFNLPYQCFFILQMFLMLYIAYKGFEPYKFILHYTVFFFVTTFFLDSLNIQRQSISVYIFIFAIRYINSKEFGKYCLCIIIATLFHKSAVILFPVYAFRSSIFSFLDKRYVQILFFILSLTVLQFAIPWIIELISRFVIGDIRYSRNIDSLGTWDLELNSGLGVLLIYAIDVIIILFSKRLCETYSKYNFNVIFRIYFVGVLLSNMFHLDVFLSRLPLALESVRIIILGFLIHYLWHSNKTIFNYCLGIIISLSILGFYFLTILNGGAGCSPFQFSIS